MMDLTAYELLDLMRTWKDSTTLALTSLMSLVSGYVGNISPAEYENRKSGLFETVH
jgi:hypothetical protein